MITFVTVLHIALCFFLILVVLLQTGKGADMGAAFGGASQTVFGATGAVSLMGKVTTVTAVLYMLTSLTLAWDSAREQQGGGGLDLDQFDRERGVDEEGTTEDEAATETLDDTTPANPDAGIGDYKDAYDEVPAGERIDGTPGDEAAEVGDEAIEGGADPPADNEVTE
jgi:preprotein translocase subunit SecG